ncbi:MAG: sulfate transporter CysZ [Pseudomonadales bacterium]
MSGNLLQGAEYLLRGFRMLGKPGIRRFVWVPLTINIAIFAALMTYSVNKFSSWIAYLLGLIPSWLDFLQWLLWPVFILLLLIIVVFTFTIVANLLSAPFNGLLAEKVELRVTQQRPPSANESGWQTVASVPKALFRELAKLLYTLPVALLIWVLTLIPTVNVVSPFLWLFWGSWMMAIQYGDYPADNNRIKFKRFRQILSGERLTSLGFGAAVLGATMVPGVNLFVIPSAICGATLLWCERLQPGAKRNL